MAKLADVIYKSEIERFRQESTKTLKGKASIPIRPVIVRFCGTSDNSINSEALMKSLRIQIEYLMGPIRRKSDKPLSNWEWFFEALYQFEVIVLLDAVDCIVDGYEFLRDISPHENTRIIISTTVRSALGASGEGSKDQKKDVLLTEKVALLEVPKLSTGPPETKQGNTDTRTVSSRAPKKEAGSDMPPSEIETIAEAILRSKSRQLTPDQMRVLVERVCEEPSILYMNLACRVVQHWPSHLVTPVLESSLSGIFSQIMGHIEAECGVKMSRMALSLITFSVRGINDNEMEDLLSMDQEVLYTIFSYDYPGVFRVPSHVWIRLRMALEGMVVERVHGCLSWHHQDLQALAEERYCSEEPEVQQALHRKMGCYFSDRVSQRELAEKKMAPFPLLLAGASPWLDACKPSHRRCEEGAYHLIKAGMFAEAINELCNFEYICAAAKSGQGFHLVSTFRSLSLALMEAGSDASLTVRVNDYFGWIERNIMRIMEAPAALIPVTVTAEPETSHARQDFFAYLARHPGGTIPFQEDVWVRGVCLEATPRDTLGGPVCINCVRWSPDDTMIATGSDDSNARMWDVATGRLLLTLKGHRKAVMGLDWHPNGSNIVTVSRDLTGIIWNAETGTMLRTLTNGHTLDIVTVAYSPDGQKIATGSKDSKVMVWRADDAASGEKLTFKKFNDFYISCVQWSPCGCFLAASTFTNSVRVWDLESKKAKTFTGGIQQVSQVAQVSWHPSGERLVSVSDDGSASIWSPHQPTTVYSTFLGHGCGVRACSWSPRGDCIVTGDLDGGILIWSPASSTQLMALKGHSDCVNDVQWSGTGTRIASCSKDGRVIVFDCAQIQL
jgi:Tol biopolymer transport system component